MSKVLVTGSAGFIGFHLVNKLLELNNEVVGIDNINDYYNPALKLARLREAGIGNEAEKWLQETVSIKNNAYRFIRMNLEDKHSLLSLCSKEQFDIIVNLAAQAGVRYSIQNPDVYVQSNIIGFLNILESIKHIPVKHFVYASSSSVYGLNKEIPFSVKHNVDHPISFYAATKKSNELMAHVYSHLYNIPCTGLRFFTVYGPWGRPDMAAFLFADAIINDRHIKVFNHGKLERDFTYIDDIIDGLIKVITKPPVKQPSVAPYKILNMGNNRPVALLDFIKEIENNINKKALKEYIDMQPGDVAATWADVNELINEYGYSPSTGIDKGIPLFIKWYRQFVQDIH